MKHNRILQAYQGTGKDKDDPQSYKDAQDPEQYLMQDPQVVPYQVVENMLYAYQGKSKDNEDTQ